MTIFLSRRPNLDPEPWAHLLDDGTEVRWASPTYDDELGDTIWSPRRDEYDTPVNRVLELWRETTNGDMRGWGIWLALAGADMLRDGEATPAEIDHARKVLQRLANLTGEGK